MSSLLQRLENNEAVLLMYVADELPAEDRAEVEQMLATDASLRAALEELREARDVLDEALRSADAGRAIAAAAPAVRRVAREMHQWQARRFAPPPPAESLPELRFPWWSYPLATAVALLIAFVVWWGTQEHDPSARDQVRSDTGGTADERYAEWEERIERNRQLRQLMWEFGGAANPEGVDTLEEVQSQLSRAAITEEDGPEYLFLWDPNDEGT